MIDRPIDETRAAGEHPDEGLIHAWLDEALDAAESERLAAHVRDCPVCQERVAEARGLIAGASRIVAALDGAPPGARSGWAHNAVSSGTPVAAEKGDAASGQKLPDRSLWRWLRVTPGRAALAATILVALGITLTHERVAEDMSREMAVVLDPQRADAPALDSSRDGGSGLAKSEVAPPRDALLDSAVARNLEIAQGRRVLKAAPGQPLPQPAPVPSPTAPPTLDGQAVAEGRATTQAQRALSGAVAADRARVGVSRDEGEPVVVTAPASPRRSDITGATASVSGTEMSRVATNAVATSCLRVENSEPGASWGDQPFPMILVVEPGRPSEPRNVSVLTAAGAPTPVRGSWSERGGDSVAITLRRIGYTGSIVLGPGDGLRTGVALSGAATPALERIVATGLGMSQPDGRAEGARAAESRKAPAAAPSAAPSAAPARDQASSAATEAGPPLRQLRVTARLITCPAS